MQTLVHSVPPHEMRKSKPCWCSFHWVPANSYKTRELSQLSNGTKRADRGAGIFTQECATPAISSCFHQDICCDVGHLWVKPSTELPFGTTCTATPYGKIQSIPKCPIFCLQNTDENHFDTNSVARQEKRPCQSTMSELRYLIPKMFYLSTAWVDSSLRPRSGALAPVFGTKSHLCCVCLRNCVTTVRACA